MKKTLEALLLVWPSGIPTQDYAKALGLAELHSRAAAVYLLMPYDTSRARY